MLVLQARQMNSIAEPAFGCYSGGGSFFQQGMITSNVPDCGYTRIEFGFSVSPQLAGGAIAGDFLCRNPT